MYVINIKSNCLLIEKNESLFKKKKRSIKLKCLELEYANTQHLYHAVFFY
jgi:hypothetical protein